MAVEAEWVDAAASVGLTTTWAAHSDELRAATVVLGLQARAWALPAEEGATWLG
jgi:hypothetical protein